jgi:hypothetical protein
LEDDEDSAERFDRHAQAIAAGLGALAGVPVGLALEETLAIMRDAATMSRLAESDAELARGEYVSADELAETMRRRQAP